ncbi:MAG: hypothetical protein PHI34_05315 [Acidobacteriota bacterium]|nr:hypothetical protein [Acidobacteriota bacterium]
MKKTLIASMAAAAALAAAFAVAPQNWFLRTYADWLRGKSIGVSLSAEGVVTLAPREDKAEGPAEEFYLSYLTGPDGTAYIGTGHGGRVFRRGKDGRVEIYFQAAEMDVTALAMDGKGILYAATSPQGKIYKIVEKDKGTEFFNPAERYIWDLAFEASGNLLAAVGEAGGIYEISPQGQGGRMIFKSAENHILCLGRDSAGALLAGSGGPGVVYRIGAGGRGQVLYETPFEEVRALAADARGVILVGAGGSLKTRKDEPAVAVPSGQTDVVISVSAASGATAAAPAAAAPRAAGSAPAAGEPGAVFKIAPDGSVSRLFAAADEMVYALQWNESPRRLLIGTGPKGRLYALDGEDKLSLLLQKDSEQIFGLTAAEGKIHLIANNPPGISVLSAEPRSEGEYIGPVFDARLPASWGRIQWEASVPQGAVVQVLTRSGNTAEPGASWSDWSPPYGKAEGEPVLSPRGRYLQMRALLKIGSGRAAPSLSMLQTAYLQANVAPVIGKLELLTPNEVYLKPIDQDEVIWGQERRNLDPPSGQRDEMKFAMAKKVERRGYQTAVWEAEDENGDALSYAVWIRADGETNWRLLEERWTDCLYTFATTQIPDGTYTLKVVASDAPSNPAEMVRAGEKTSAAFLVDNAAPEIKNLQVQKSGGLLNVSFQAEDRFSAVREVRYLLRPDDWRIVFPEDGICDGRTERFSLKAPLPAASDGSLTIWIRDAAGNAATFKTAF